MRNPKKRNPNWYHRMHTFEKPPECFSPFFFWIILRSPSKSEFGLMIFFFFFLIHFSFKHRLYTCNSICWYVLAFYSLLARYMLPVRYKLWFDILIFFLLILLSVISINSRIIWITFFGIISFFSLATIKACPMYSLKHSFVPHFSHFVHQEEAICRRGLKNVENRNKRIKS